MIHTLVISAFPGTGKSHFCKDKSMLYVDSDSSTFPKEEFPQNYIEHIKSKFGVVKGIFVSTHIDVRNALKEEGIPYFSVFPTKDQKDEYIKRIYDRPDNKVPEGLIDKMWDPFIDSLMSEMDDEMPGCLPLHRDQYISDVMDFLEK